MTDPYPHLNVIFHDIQQRVTAATDAFPAWPCRRGCDACCRRLANPPDLTAAEWQCLHAAFLALPSEVQHSVAIRIRALTHRDPTNLLTCPFLDEEQGECRVYDARPAACRMYGFYVTRDNNQWCSDVQTLYDAGDLDGVILGNHTAVTRELTRSFGETQPLHLWFNEGNEQATSQN